MTHNFYYLVVDIVLVLLQLIVIVSNGFILFLFTRVKRLRQNFSRHLVVLLTITDFVHAVATLPYTIYLVISWDPVYLSLSSHYVMVSSIPVMIQLKISLTLTISVAVERILALYFPVGCCNLSIPSYALFSLLFGFLLGVLDVILEFSLTRPSSTLNCSGIGCFLDETFRCYWGISNMVMGIVVIVLMILILIKQRVLRLKPQHLRANRRSIGILLMSLVSVALPSVGAGLAKAIGLHVFNDIGPLFIAGLLCAGACNSFICLALNKEMQEAARRFITCDRSSFPLVAITIKVLSTVGK
uniref:G_PROTEIN_RECEP_F1_2 domain-containing protein n=1 Tax=Angiostrongylus cantonensis TaxID=6313 RepID=A0A0K0CZB0_ANGCA